jgi:hypothetical protein
VHSYRLVNTEGKSHFVKFLGNRSLAFIPLVWDEAVKLRRKHQDAERDTGRSTLQSWGLQARQSDRASGEGVELVKETKTGELLTGDDAAEQGLPFADDADSLAPDFTEAVANHRFHNRRVDKIMA